MKIIRAALAVGDNAMFYKDVTQWLRTRSFTLLFALLLSLAELACLFTAFAPMGEGSAGPALLGMLCAMLAFYLMIQAFMAFASTSREHSSRTFELYELSGMSLEKMVGGKLFSQLGQFCFGFSCLVPFLFFGYLLGGVDFYTIFAITLLFSLGALPVYLVSILSSLMMRFRAMAGIGRIFIAIGIFVFVVMGFNVISFFFAVPYMMRGGGGMRGPGSVIKLLLSFDRDAWLAAGLFLLYYVQACLLMFYGACNAISPPSDTRESQVKCFMSGLMTTWICTAVWLGSGAGGVFGGAASARFEYQYVYCVPVAIMLAVLGVAGYYHRLDPPLMAVRRAQSARIWLKPFHWLFAPGARGTLRVMTALLALAIIATAVLDHYRHYSNRPFKEWITPLSYPLSMPYFLMVPLGFVAHLRRLRGRHKTQRAIVLVWWAASGAIAMIVYMFFTSGASYRGPGYNPELAWLSELVCLLISPVSTGTAGASPYSKFTAYAPVIRAGFGLAGLVMMHISLHLRARAETRALGELARLRPAAPPAPPTAPAPESAGGEA